MPDAGVDDGYSLVEVLAAVTLMSIVMVAIVSALGVMVTSSREHRQLTNAQVVLASAAEKVKGSAYVPCTSAALGSAYDAVATSAARPSDWGAGGTVTVDLVEYWDAATSGFVDPAVTQCSNDLGLERVTMSVTSPDGRAVETASILKSGVGATTVVGGGSACVVKSPSAELLPNGTPKNPIKVDPGELETFTVHLEPNSCPDGAWPLWLQIPGLAERAELALVPNPSSADPTWQAEDVLMPEATVGGWDLPGTILTAVLYDGLGFEAGRFWLEVQ